MARKQHDRLFAVAKAVIEIRRANEKLARGQIVPTGKREGWSEGKTFFFTQLLTARLNDQDGVAHGHVVLFEDRETFLDREVTYGKRNETR